MIPFSELICNDDEEEENEDGDGDGDSAHDNHHNESHDN